MKFRFGPIKQLDMLISHPDIAAPTPLYHGGGVDAAAARFGIPADDWLDLSTGINPVPYPLPPLAAALWRRLPDRDQERALRAAAALAYGVADPAHVVPAPGSQALIQWLPRLRRPGRVAVLGPTYAEHAAAWAAAGHEATSLSDPARLAEADVAIAVNPNNPDGRAFAPPALLDLAAKLERRGGWLVVDEAFADTTPELSLASSIARPGLVALRSFGKFFGLAGLRLGFALAGPEIAIPLRAALGPWCVSGPAAEIAICALGDRAWIARTRRRLATDAARLDGLLADAGLGIVGGTSLFRLATHAHAADLFEHLGRHGILARRFPEHPSWLRFGLPGEENDWARLVAALAAWAVPG